MKRTQIVTHVMPTEIDEYSYIVDKLTEASHYLEKNDWISIYATLNISTELVYWNESELNADFFIEKFNRIKEKASWANELIFEIVDDNSILGTTAQKRKAIKGDYDQFIFLDCDIVFNPMTLKYMLMASEEIKNEYYFLTPQTVKLWDYTWDLITHKDFDEKEYGYEKHHTPEETYNQTIDEISVDTLENINQSAEKATIVLRHRYTNQYNAFTDFKFACGWFTLYSKSAIDLLGIPEWLGHYGPEDTYMMYGSQFYKIEKWPIYQYVLQGIYVSENYVSRDTKYKDKVKLNNLKDKFRAEAESKFSEELSKLKYTIKRFN